MASDSIYRVRVRTTSSRQPGGSFWHQEVLYCGPSLRDARVAYLREVAEDYGGGFGSSARETFIERFAAEPDEIDDEAREAVE